MSRQRVSTRRRIGIITGAAFISAAVAVVSPGASVAQETPTTQSHTPDAQRGQDNRERYMTAEQRQEIQDALEAARPHFDRLPRVERATPLDTAASGDRAPMRRYLTLEQDATVRAEMSAAAERAGRSDPAAGQRQVSESDLDFWVLPVEEVSDRLVAAFPAGTPVMPDGSTTAESDFADDAANWSGFGIDHAVTEVYYTSDDGGNTCGRTDGRLIAYKDARRMVENYSTLDYVGSSVRAILDVFEDTGAVHCIDYIDYGYGKHWSNNTSARWADWDPWYNREDKCNTITLAVGYGPGSISTNIQSCDQWQTRQPLYSDRAADYANSHFAKYVSDNNRDDDYHIVEGFAIWRLPAGHDSARAYAWGIDLDNDPCGAAFCYGD